MNYNVECNSNDNSVEYKRDLLIYLDSQGILNEIKSTAVNYSQNLLSFSTEGIFLPPFRFVLTLDLLRMQEISYKLFNSFVAEPDDSIKFAREVIYHALKVLTSLKNYSISDIQIVGHISSFPNINFLSESFHNVSKGLQAVCGVLIGRTMPYKYMRSKVYFCKRTTCLYSNGRRCQPPFTNICPICFSLMDEDVRSLDTGDEVIAQIICLNAFNNIGRFQSVKIKIRDELCMSEALQIGLLYNFVVTYEDEYFKVWNISRKLARFEILSKVNDLYPLPVSSSVADIYYIANEHCPGSPWAFVGAISSTLASNILPVSSFLQLKVGLMLSLATQNTEDAPVPIVAAGSDTSAVQKLISSAGQLAERFIRYSAGYEQLGGDKRRNNLEEIYYDAGAMVLAITGVCYLGDWSMLRKDQCKHICQSIESGQVILNNADKNKTETDFLPLKCALWTHYSPITSRNHDQLQLKTLMEVFGMPFLAEENDELEVHKISMKILQSSIDGIDNEQSDMNIPLADFKEFISLINSRNLILNQSASKLIHDFFVVIRKERPEYLPMRAIKTITSLAEAHARLALRNEITYADVIAILYLYNESVSALFGSPFIKSKNNNIDKTESLYRSIHARVENFQLSVENFLESYLFI